MEFTSAPVTLTVTPGFLNIETLNTARASTTITMLNTGQALIAAGSNSAGVIVNSAELYNPATNTFSSHREPEHRPDTITLPHCSTTARCSIVGGARIPAGVLGERGVV